MRFKLSIVSMLLFLMMGTTGCGSFVAHRIVQAPNTYPKWLAPEARVELAFESDLLTNFPARFVDVGPPAARLRYRVVEPAEYHFRTTSTNWVKKGKEYATFSFKAQTHGATNAWTGSPRGTVILLHGYALGQFAMMPWAFQLAQDGWLCVLVDLRGHGKSTGKRIYYGIVETNDLSQLLNELDRNGQLKSPVAALGESYGAALALRWKTVEPRIASVVAIAPYASLSNAVMNICHEYAHWMPKWYLRSGLKKLPSVLKIGASELDTSTVLARSQVAALFIAGTHDQVMPLADVQQLYEETLPGSKWLAVTNATHESLPYYFDQLGQPVSKWLNNPASP